MREALSPKLNRLPMRGTVCSDVPRIPTLQEHVVCHESLDGADALQCRQPVTVVSVATVRVASCLRIADCLIQTFCPFCPGEHAALVQGHCHGKRLGFPRCTENGPGGVARQ